MIPRYQKILFVVLLLASLGMGFLLWQLRDRAQKRMQSQDDSVPTEAPIIVPDVQATLMVADDLTNSLTPQARALPLPTESGARARALLAKLFEIYATPGASHPVPGGPASVAQLFLVPLPASGASDDKAPQPAASTTGIAPAAASPAATKTQPKTDGPLLAVVNLTGAFANAHPSGLAAENLTVLSICATLRANLSRVAQVRFLVDGAQRPTLAGHADLTRTYLTAETVPSHAP